MSGGRWLDWLMVLAVIVAWLAFACVVARHAGEAAARRKAEAKDLSHPDRLTTHPDTPKTHWRQTAANGGKRRQDFFANRRKVLKGLEPAVGIEPTNLLITNYLDFRVFPKDFHDIRNGCQT